MNLLPTGSDMQKEVDWVLNEVGDIATTESVRRMLGKLTRLVTCLVNWSGQYPVEIVPAAIKEKVGLYGFILPIIGSMMPPVDYYLSKSVYSLKGNERNKAVFARGFNHLPIK